MSEYLFMKSLHLLGVVLFLGNIIMAAVRKVLGDRTHNPAVIACTERLVTIKD